MHLSRTRILNGLQCPKQLWWRVHEPGAAELLRSMPSQWELEEGRKVAELARTHAPGGVLIDIPHGSVRDRVTATEEALGSGARVIYEAAFLAGGVYAQVDILERLDRGFALTEVKSSLSVKPPHLNDLAVQVHVVSASGIDVRAANVMHLNRDCVHPDLTNLFVIEDVTAEAATIAVRLPPRIAALQVALGGSLPDVAIGRHCDDPHPCPFKSRCWPVPLPHELKSLYQSHTQLVDLEAAGYATILDLPPGLDLNAIAERQRRAVQTGRMVVQPGLAEALRVFEPPLAYLDFETVDPAIPVWPRCRPYANVPVQFSCHVEHADGTFTHHQAIANGNGDPRPEIARRVADVCRGARTVVAYYSPFDAECLEQLAVAAPERAAELREIASRLRDPLPILRDFVYHPEFRGSFSLKSVLRPLVPELGYDDLEIREGGVASVQLKRLLLDSRRLDPPQAQHIRGALERYAERDTWAMVKLLERLHAIAKAG